MAVVAGVFLDHVGEDPAEGDLGVAGEGCFRRGEGAGGVQGGLRGEFAGAGDLGAPGGQGVGEGVGLGEGEGVRAAGFVDRWGGGGACEDSLEPVAFDLGQVLDQAEEGEDEEGTARVRDCSSVRFAHLMASVSRWKSNQASRVVRSSEVVGGTGRPSGNVVMRCMLVVCALGFLELA